MMTYTTMPHAYFPHLPIGTYKSIAVGSLDLMNVTNRKDLIAAKADAETTYPEAGSIDIDETKLPKS
jgi:hypothetical protein